MKPILPFKWRKGISKFLQTPEEKNLEEKTLKAMGEIAEALDIPKEEYQKELPIIKYNPNAKSCSWNKKKQIICYKVDQDISIYEETGHYLAEHYAPKDEGSMDCITTFFKMGLSEGVGYFCSNLSGTKRTDRFMYLPRYNHEREETLKLADPAMIKSKVSQERKEKAVKYFKKRLKAQIEKDRYIEDKGMELYKLTNKYTEDNQETKDLIERLDEITPDTGSLEIIKEYFSKDMKDLGSHIYSIPQVDMHMYQRFYHLIGYDLGDEVTSLYKQDKKEGQRILKRMMSVPRNNAVSEFFKIQKEMKELGFSPIILDVNDLLVGNGP